MINAVRMKFVTVMNPMPSLHRIDSSLMDRVTLLLQGKGGRKQRSNGTETTAVGDNADALFSGLRVFAIFVGSYCPLKAPGNIASHANVAACKPRWCAWQLELDVRQQYFSL